MGDLVIGVDAGGTATRCVLASADGRVLGRGEAGGANQRSSDGDNAGRLTETIRGALGDVPPNRVGAGVFGIAGAGSAGRAAARGAAQSAWRSAGLHGRPDVVTDIAVAFAAGTSAKVGTVLIAGTGAVAAAVDVEEIVARCDGYGWLLGDEGSAVWQGREAIRAALAAIDGRGRPTNLARAVPRLLLGEEGAAQAGAGGLAQAIVAVAHERSPAHFGTLAPVVGRAAAAGDAAAADIAADAAARLLAAVDAVRADPGRPVVLAGSVLDEGPVADAVRAGLAERRLHFVTAAEGALGAAALALRRLDGAGPSDAVYTALTTAR